MPLLGQVKLLRVSQSNEIQRVGSDETVEMDPRIVAATNRNLLEIIREGRFRKAASDQAEKFFLEQALQEVKGKVSELANQTGMNRSHLQTLPKKHGICSKDFKEKSAANLNTPISVHARGGQSS